MRKRTVVITGADRGLGYELARQCAERGDMVYAGKYRTNWHLLEELKEKYPDRVEIVPLDVRYDESVKRAAEMILGKSDKIDILLNVAGVWLSHNSGTVLDGHFDYGRMMEEFNVNALGSLRVTEALIHAVLNGYDRVVANLSSEAASITSCQKTDQPGYCMSKAAINMWSSVVLNTIKSRGGTVLNFHPGWMQSVIGSSAEPDAPFEELPDEDKVQFYTTPEHTAEGILHILDEPERFAGSVPAFINYHGDVMKY